MPVDNYSHDDYFGAFQQFMQTGENEQLTSYLGGKRSAAFLSVYRNGFIRASASALESNFPSVVKLWGEDYFAQVSAAYVSLAPPSSATLIGYGFDTFSDVPNVETLNPEPSNYNFIEFLQNNLSEIVQQYPYVTDLCRLDQAWLESLNENGESFLTLEAVQEMIAEGKDLAELPLALVDSSRIVNLTFDIFELWGQLRFGDVEQQEQDQKIELNEQENAVIFWQKDLQVQAKPLSDVEAVFMQSLKQSADIDKATNLAIAADENFDISTLFAELLTANLLQY